MKSSLSTVCGALLLALSPLTFAQAPAAAPAGSTGLCKDGSYSSAESKSGACAGHKGVKEWYGAAAAPAAMKPASAAKSEAKAMPPKSTAGEQPAAPGGGAGQVWVNTKSKVYHCPGTKYYGKTKKGEYMTEAAAKAAGSHADHGKACV